jgi:hypothetical protein
MFESASEQPRSEEEGEDDPPVVDGLARLEIERGSSYLVLRTAYTEIRDDISRLVTQRRRLKR